MLFCRHQLDQHFGRIECSLPSCICLWLEKRRRKLARVLLWCCFLFLCFNAVRFGFPDKAGSNHITNLADFAEKDLQVDLDHLELTQCMTMIDSDACLGFSVYSCKYVYYCMYHYRVYKSVAYGIPPWSNISLQMKSAIYDFLPLVRFWFYSWSVKFIISLSISYFQFLIWWRHASKSQFDFDW